ncbi:MAG: type II toxin-antitoxin system VapC family toxin [Oscillospiraceae bacterium]|nr:type II toxin-antitoxin system VapC family toxin [Oscillospiraceae bacterium]
MKPAYVLDACALIAYLTDEPGVEVVERHLLQATGGTALVYMHKLNLLEVYYGFLRSGGKARADEMLHDIAESGIEIIENLADPVFQEAGRLKALYRISLADSVALAEAVQKNAAILTSDHHEFDIVQRNEPIQFEWIR